MSIKVTLMENFLGFETVKDEVDKFIEKNCPGCLPYIIQCMLVCVPRLVM